MPKLDGTVEVSMAFSRQPVDILDEVTSTVDSIPDFSHLSAVSKLLYSVVAPRHISYRTIKALSRMVGVDQKWLPCRQRFRPPALLPQRFNVLTIMRQPSW